MRAFIMKTFYNGTYAADHWALKPYDLKDPKVIALAQYKDSRYAVFLNPTDKRGYRSIAALIKNEDMASTLNRDYTPQERSGLGLVIQLVSNVYSNILPIAQSSILGNNSHKFQGGTTYLGTPEEPCLLHGHIYGRGNPDFCYVDGVKLDGPAPGQNFDMMNGKVKWQNSEMEKVAAAFKQEMAKVKEGYPDLHVNL